MLCKSALCKSVSHFGKAAWPLMAMFGLAVSGCNGSIFSGSTEDNLPGVDLRTVNVAGLGEVIESQKGRVVLVDFWATWCPPCRALFPHNVALQQQYLDQGLTVLTVSVDGPAEKSAVKSFLRQHPGQTLNFLASDDTTGRSDPFGIGESIPCIKIYDRHGMLSRTLVGPSEADIDRAVRTLLAEK
jgi:thiol-disulfide isomerase/thioredoxin